MSTKLTDLGDKVLIQTVASWHGGAARSSHGVLVDANDRVARKAEMLRQGDRLRRQKGLEIKAQ